MLACDSRPLEPASLLAQGASLLHNSQAAEAADLLRDCCALVPDHAEAWNLLGSALAEQGKVLNALASTVRAHLLAPGHLPYALRRAELACLAKVAEVELPRLESLSAEHPDCAAPLAAQALILHRTGRNAEAADLLEAACVLEPEQARLWSLFGAVLARGHQLVRAEAAMRRALELDPSDLALRHDRAVVLFRLHRFAEAKREMEAVGRAKGEDALLLCNLANATLCLGLQDEALSHARRAARLFPNDSIARRALVNTLPYAPGTAPSELLSELRGCAAVLPRPARPHGFPNAPDPNRQLRIGLLAGMLKTHPVGWLTVAAWEALDPARFQLVGIAATMPNDPISRRFRAAAADWIDPGALDDEALASACRAKQIDILVDLGGYGDLGRMQACAHRLAPVQVKWVGMQNHSSGLPEIDWFITDRWETPPHLRAHYSERLLELPDGYVCYSPAPDSPAASPLPMLSRDYPTFGCFTNMAKVNPQVIAVWSRVLRAVPGSRFVLKSHALADPETAGRVRTAFAEHGVDPGRLDLRGPSPHRQFLIEWSDIDIALDTFPYTGGLTTVEALWMGVPTITLPGEIFAARHSFSHLNNAGLGDWAATDLEDYVAQAARRASAPAELAVLRAGLREMMLRSPLCDARRFGTNLGNALRLAWRDWCGSR